MRLRQSAFKVPAKSLDESDFTARGDGTSNDRGDDDDAQDDTKPKVCFNLHSWIDANVLSRRCHKRVTPYTTFTMKWIATTKEKSESQETGTSSVSTETSASLQ